ncbi:1-acyl-sn-glycerol-3-phosphate acyltransferase [candidate division WOR-3 bacterium]|nr:1-acyl-sn-glycerol-3-phosphate acyltransferase [candidate division WOR-3 bacterium]
MKQHGGAMLWPSELYTFFTTIKDAFIGFYGRLVRIKVFGEEMWRELRSNAIVVANHVTGADSIILQIALKRRLFMLAARKWFQSRFIGFFMTFFCEMVPVALEKGARNLLGIKRALALLKNRQSLAVYPSGRMNRDDCMQEINDGAAYLSIKSGAPIVPVYLKNLAYGPEPGSRPWITETWEGLGSVAHNIFNRKIEVYIAPPIYPRKEVVDRKEEIKRLNAEIRRSFDELHQKASLS